MEKLEIKKHLINAVKSQKAEDGWANLVNLGATLKANGLDYKALGYEKLFQLIRENSDCLSWKTETLSPKNFVIYVKEKTLQEKAKHENIKKVQNTGNYAFDPANALNNWASLGDFSKMIEGLKRMCLNERWFYNQQNTKQPFPILINYLKYTFYRLSQEKNKIIEKENYASFNTGLVDKRYEPIFALFSKTPNALRKWKFEAFCIAGEDKYGKELVRNFNPLPPRAHYFDKVSDMLYDTLSPKPELDWHHIVVENIDRLPLDFLYEHRPKDFVFKNIENMSNTEQETYYEELAKAIVEDNKTYRNITNRFKDSLELSLKRIQWNFKTAIPMYFPTTNKMSILLPLALIDDEKVDIALVVEKTESGNYLGHTILPLNWAYNNARLVCRPDSDWLVAEHISTKIIDESL